MSCSGVCCAVFMMSKGYEEFVNRPEEIIDGPYIADMLVPLTHAEAEERAARFGVNPPNRDTQFYTCRHWNEDTRLCMAYESRPGMCRKYPYDRACDFGCGLRLETPETNCETKVALNSSSDNNLHAA